MPTNSELVNDLRQHLAEPLGIVGREFELLKGLATIVADATVPAAVSQELVLRSLARRDEFLGFVPILDSLIRLTGLFPYLDPSKLSFQDQIAFEYHRPDGLVDDIVFHRPQSQVYRLLLTGENVALSAPTSFGKSLVIDALLASQRYKNVVIVVPTIALIDETRRRLARRFRNQFKIITHNGQARELRNAFVLTQERVLEFDELDIVDLVVIDEFYKLSPVGEQDHRSFLLNQALYRLMKRAKQVYLLGPGVSRLSEEFQRATKCRFVQFDYNTVVSDIRRVPKSNRHRKTSEIGDLVTLCADLKDPTLVFCSSPKRAQEVASGLMSIRPTAPGDDVQSAAQWVAANYHPDWSFGVALRNGVGIHHGRIPRALAQYAVRKFNEGSIRFLACTSTLIEGVNTKAKNIVVFDNKIDRKRIDLFTFNNIRGRSGRMFQHVIGNVYVFDEPPEDQLPEVDVPIYSQHEDTPTTLLIQIDADDLRDGSKARLQRYADQEIVSYSTLKMNKGVDLDSQLDAAYVIHNNASSLHELLAWREKPNRAQLVFICQLMFRSFNGLSLGRRSVLSASQLASRIENLQERPTMRELIATELAEANLFQSGSVEEAVQRTLDFVRLWAGFHFPRLLRVLNNIQADIYSRMGMTVGDYGTYAKQVENLFLDPAIVALDEYGIPLELARKLEAYIASDGNLDLTLAALRRLETRNLNLTYFENEVVRDAQNYI